ncbi:MAG: hypothetical protein AB9903_34330 [Vulcanimicrobiota bacterium]
MTTNDMEKMIESVFDEQIAQKEFTFITDIDGQEVEYTRDRFFNEVENKATYRTEKRGYSVEDNDTYKAAFKKLAELRSVSADTAYHWIHDIAAEMLADYQADYSTLSALCEGDGPIHLMQQIEKMSSLFGIVLSYKSN